MVPEAKATTVKDKALATRNLWEEMHLELERSDESAEIRQLMEERLARVKSGELELLDWEQVKGRIGCR